MASFGKWDGSSCDDCIARNCHGVDEDTPCRKCGWFRATFTGARYPPGFCASSWRFATERIRDLRKEFPDVPKEIISNIVQSSGENDMEADIARNYLNAHTSSQKLCAQNSSLEYDDFFFVISLLLEQKMTRQEYRGQFVDGWTMEDIESIALKIVTKMKDVREKSMSVRGEESCDSDFISDVSGWSFDKHFDRDMTGAVVDIVHALIGCYHCYEENPTKACSKCIARYCSKECQALAWKDEEEPHKEMCGKLATIKDKDQSGEKILIELYTRCLIEGEKMLEMAMNRRTATFLDEVCRCSSASWRESTARSLINLDFHMVYIEPGKMSIVANAMFLDDKLQAWYNSAEENKGICLAGQVFFKVLNSGLDDEIFQAMYVRRNDIPEGMKLSAISHISGFLKEAKERGINVLCITCSESMNWLYDEKWHRKLCIEAPGCDVKLHDKRNPEVSKREWAIQE